MVKYLGFLLIGLCLYCATASAQPTLNLLGQIDELFWNDMSDIWGYADGNGNEYAIATTQTGISIVDVTDPTNPNEIEYINGSNTLWRDAKVWNDYAYIVSEGNDGLVILDLSDLNNNIPVSQWQGDNYNGNNINFEQAHNIFIDENGIGYVVGAKYAGFPGIIMLDIASNPTDPDVIGMWHDRYVHDIFVRDDIAWTADIEDGLVSIIDISSKANPNVLNTISTPYNFAHALWLSDDDQTLFVTEEVGGAAVSVYDVGSVFNIQLIDQYRSNPGSNVIPHNVFVKGNYIYTSYYRDGVTAADISDPTNLTQVADYDTSPNFSGNGFNGAWGVYPYLPSGNILVTDIENGLFILEGEPTVVASDVTVSLKTFLEGAYETNQGKMHTLLNSVVPLTQPYANAPYNYGGTESLTSIPANMVDWVLVEAREGTPNLSGNRTTVTVETQAAILLDDGSIVSVDGTTQGLKFTNLTLGNDYHFCVRHRNHLDILTANSLPATSIINYDFTTNINTALGSSQLKMATDGNAVMYAGEYSQDNVIQLTDFDIWRLEPAQLTVYISTDGNLDGVVQVTDYDIWAPNKAKLGISEIDF